MKRSASQLGIPLEIYIANTEKGLKRCSKCKTWLKLRNFATDNTRYDSKATVCRDCAYTPTTNKLGKRLSRQMAKDGLALCTPCCEWYPKDQIRKNMCRDHRNADYRERYKTNEKFRRNVANRNHARKRDAEPIAADVQIFLMNLFQNKCAYCDNDATGFDHIVPIVKGGKSDIENLVPACQSCNSSKNDNNVLIWLIKTNREPRTQFYQVLHGHFPVISLPSVASGSS